VKRRIVIRGHACSWDGYGQAAEWLAKGLESQGWETVWLPIGDKMTEFGKLSEWIERRLVKEAHPAWPILQMSTPATPPLPGRNTVTFTMWESTRINGDAIGALNRARAVVTPCAFNAATFSAAGVDSRLFVCPLGYDPHTYFPREVSPGVCRIGLAGRMAHGGCRKGIEEGIRAWFAALDSGTELYYKGWPDDPLPTIQHPRVTIFSKPMTRVELRDFYDSLTLLMVPTKGEGFGLQTLEAMACGVPVAASQWSGTAELIDDESGYLLPYRLGLAQGIYGGHGHWCIPDEEAMTDVIRRVASDPEEAQRKGKAAARRAERFTWDLCAQRLDSILCTVLGIK
jgi:glycosyltransferase involved in cell wall biosynthesis